MLQHQMSIVALVFCLTLLCELLNWLILFNTSSFKGVLLRKSLCVRACVCVCMHARVHMCVHVCMCVRVSLCVCTCAQKGKKGKLTIMHAHKCAMHKV